LNYNGVGTPPPAVQSLQPRNDQNGLSIDNLQYFYNTASNRSKSVYDHAVNIASHNNNGKALGADIYSYDINGNLTTDPYRGVITNVYNHLVLPTTVAKSASNRMVMTYDATGRLLTRKTYTTSSSIPSETREYIGPFEYVNGTLDFIQTSQGRYKNISGNLRHEYVINDHLGSARIWYADVNNNGFTDQSEILDENHYYAYGMEMQGSFINSTGFNYKFNGIERVESYNMDFALYRGLDPVLGKWYQVDPKAEAMMGMSPYCAMNNNPVLNADPEGDLPFLAIVAIGAATGVFSNGLSNVSNGQDFFNGAGKAALWGGIGAAASFGVGVAFGATGSFGHELLRAGAHGLTQGGISAAQGGNFWQGALSGSIGSGISSGIDALGGTAGHQILGGGLGGGIGSAISGGNFWQGFGQGVAVGAFNHALHSGLSEGGDPPTKEELKLYLANEYLSNKITKVEYINSIVLIDEGGWGLIKEVLGNHKGDIAMAALPVSKIAMLGRYFASLDQVSRSGTIIAEVVKDAPRLVAKYGSKVDNWRKMSSTTYNGRDGFKFATHWYENIKTGLKYEFKTKIGG
jgi:RHS repeat-associated protein